MDADSGQPTFGKLLGQLILRKRRAAGLTQTQLAEDAFGTSGKTRRISELENGSVANPHPRTIDPIISVLKITDAELEDCAALAEDSPDQELDRAYREARNLIESAARQFDHARPNASLAELDDYLRSKAREWRQLRQRIDEIDTADRALELMQGEAQIALANGDFDRVDDLLAQAEETQQQEHTLREIERQAEIRITRGDTYLFREDAEGALECYVAAAKYFDPFEPKRAAEMLSHLAGRVYETSLRSLTPRFAIACRLLDHLIVHPFVKSDPIESGIANYRRGLVYRNEAVCRYGEPVDEVLLRKAVGFDRSAVDAIEGNDASDFAVCARINLGISLMELAKLEPQAAHLIEALSVLKTAQVMAEEEVPPLLPFASNNIGAVYLTMLRAAPETESLALLDAAEAAYRRGADEAERYCNVEAWGAARLNRARILSRRSTLLSEEKECRFLRIRAMADYSAVLETYPSTLFPDRFAEANFELAGVLSAHAVQSKVPLADFYFGRALDAYAAASAVFSRDQYPRRWADIHMRVGALFANWAQIMKACGKPAEDHLQQAHTCFDAAAGVFDSIGDNDRAKSCRDASERVGSETDVESPE